MAVLKQSKFGIKAVGKMQHFSWITFIIATQERRLIPDSLLLKHEQVLLKSPIR
jgi:hypothetical protein